MTSAISEGHWVTQTLESGRISDIEANPLECIHHENCIKLHIVWPVPPSTLSNMDFEYQYSAFLMITLELFRVRVFFTLW